MTGRSTFAGVLFDMHGTLAFENPAVPVQWEIMAHRLKRTPDAFNEAFAKDFRSLMGGRISAQERSRRVLADLGLNSDSASIQNFIAMETQIRSDAASLYPGVEELLSNLRAEGLKLGLVSNCTPVWETIVHQLDLPRMLDLLILSCNVRLLKPQREIFLQALTGLGLDARRTLYVGDGGDNELAVAAELGMTSVYMDHEPKMTFREEPSGYQHRASRYDEIEQLIQAEHG